MKKNHHKNKSEQIFSQKLGKAPVYDKLMPYQDSASMRSGGFQSGASVDEYSIQLRDYQLDRDQRGNNLNY